MSNLYRKTYQEVYLDKIYENYKMITEKSNNKTIIPVVKADAYGLGSLKVVDYLYHQGITFYAVATVEEALTLRKQNQNIDILVMGLVNKEDLVTLSKNKITVTIPNRHLFDAVCSLNKPLKIHLKIDTGMNRLGFKDFNKVSTLFNKLKKFKHLDLEGIYTHLATSDSDEAYAFEQIKTFKSLLSILPYHPKMIHVSNSSAALKFEKDMAFTTHARVGISLYGETLEKNVNYLKKTFTVKSVIKEIKPLKKGEMLGYDITYKAKKDEHIAILQIGYADGIWRKNQGGNVSINNKLYPIVGRVCMDQMFIKVDETVQKNDIVILVGDNLVSVNDMAKRLNTIPHEILCGFKGRIPRIYKD